MTAREKSELGLIGLTTVASALFAAHLPAQLSSGDIVLHASVLLLAQGLLRDLWIKYAVRRPAEPADASVLKAPVRPLCLCLESSVGVLGVLIGLLLLAFSATNVPLNLPRWFWPVLAGAVLLGGFLIKDLVLDWRTRSVRREKDHQNIVFW